MNMEIVLPEGALGSNAHPGSLSEALRELTKLLVERGDGELGGGLGGEYGYGMDFENETFLMHRYCWCELEDCPWCGGCQEEYPHQPHAEDCYQTHVQALRGEDWAPKHSEAIHEGAKYALCESKGLDYYFGNEVHCDCGAREEAERLFDSCGCDWHLGKGPFRFGPAAQGPNFWHKPSNVRVYWYKWIGRSMEIAGGDEAQAIAAVADACRVVRVRKLED